MKGFYITTPIYYVNGEPHIGHAYTTIIADVIARWHRLRGEKVFFLTGTDDHGEKVEKAALSKGLTPEKFSDLITEMYKRCWKTLDISNDFFIRTSDKSHEEIVVEFVKKVYEKGDIYKGKYEGWYCVYDETFIMEMQLKEGKCPECGRAVKRVVEESYFFKLSKYQKRLLKFYEDNKEFLSPDFRSDEIINRVKSGLNDLSITRKNVKWGVPFPFDKGATLYVWFDALPNYITALGWPKGEKFKEFWPADVHLVGKEINWFHSVIWPAMLFSAGTEPPRKVFAHGWWTVDGKKMSKSVGNVVDPIEMSKKYSADAFRYFLVREMPFGDDGDFSEKALVSRLNNELAADLGNLLYRVISLVEKFYGKIEGSDELYKELDLSAFDKKMLNLDTFGALDELWRFVKASNKYVNDKRPWELKGKELGNVLYNLLEACRVISILVSPFMPETAAKMQSQLGVKDGKFKDCKFRKFEGKVKKGDYLFRKVKN